MGLYIQTVYVDATDSEHRYGAGEDGLTETAYDDPGDLFRSLQGRSRLRPWEDSMGRCTGKVYVDIPGSPCSLCKRDKAEHAEPPYPPVPPTDRTWMVDPARHRYQADVRHIGWVFVKRERYEDSRDGKTWLREAWVTVHTEPPTVTRTPHYAELRA